MAIHDLTASLDLKQNLNLFTNCKQLDNLNLIFSIYDNSVATNLTEYTVRLKATKADKVPLIQEHIGISISNNIITIEADEQLTTTSGKTIIELQFINKTTGKKKATFNLVLIVTPSTIEVDRTINKATYTLLEELENKLDQATDYFENVSVWEKAHPDIMNLDERVTNNTTQLNTIENTKKIKSYTSPTQYGVTMSASTTINNICSALPNSSTLFLNTDIPTCTTLIASLPDQYMFLHVSKESGARCSLRLTANNGTLYVASYYGTTDTFSGWKQVAYTDDIVAKTTGSATALNGATIEQQSIIKVGKWVEVKLVISGITATGTYANIGAGFRSNLYKRVTGTCTGTNYCRFEVSTTGDVIIGTTSVSPITTSTWFELNIGYFVA